MCELQNAIERARTLPRSGNSTRHRRLRFCAVARTAIDPCRTPVGRDPVEVVEALPLEHVERIRTRRVPASHEDNSGLAKATGEMD